MREWRSPTTTHSVSSSPFVQDLGSRLSDFSAALLSDIPDDSNIRTTASHHELAAASVLGAQPNGAAAEGIALSLDGRELLEAHEGHHFGVTKPTGIDDGEEILRALLQVGEIRFYSEFLVESLYLSP